MLRLSSSIDARRVTLADYGWVKPADPKGVTSADSEGVTLTRRVTPNGNGIPRWNVRNSKFLAVEAQFYTPRLFLFS